MAGWTSLDDYINETTVNGKTYRADWNKLTFPAGVQAAGEWNCLFHSAGNPTNGILNGGTNKSFQTLTEYSAGAIPTGGLVGDYKQLVNIAACSAAATTMPTLFQLVDILGYYPLSTVTTTGDQATINSVAFTADNTTDIITTTGYDIATFSRVTVSNSGGALPAGLAAATDYWTIRQSATTSKLAATLADAVAGTAIDFTTNGTGTQTILVGLPRYTDGAGVQCFITCNTACGAATPSLRITYTDQGGTAGAVTPTTLPVGKTSPIIGMIPYTGTGLGKYSQFMPLAIGDYGIRSIQQVNLSVSYVSGTLAYCLARPIADIPMTTIGVQGERDLLNQQPSLPRIYDGACLAWLMYAGAATPINSGFFGRFDFGWG